MTTLWIVSPCYNEEETLPKSIPVFIEKLNALIAASIVSPDSRLLLVNDGSTDRTLRVMKTAKDEFPDRIKTLSLSKNSGETAACLCGMKKAVLYADVVITIDCDLQDDIDAIDEMLQQYDMGAEIVYGCRPNRKSDPLFYRICADSFYKLMRVFGSKIVPHSSQYRLMTKAAIQKFLPETDRPDLFLPAQVPLLGLNSANVYYSRKERIAGKSKYNYVSLAKLAISAFKGYTALFQTAAVAGICVGTVLICAGGRKRR